MWTPRPSWRPSPQWTTSRTFGSQVLGVSLAPSLPRNPKPSWMLEDTEYMLLDAAQPLPVRPPVKKATHSPAWICLTVSSSLNGRTEASKPGESPHFCHLWVLRGNPALSRPQRGSLTLTTNPQASRGFLRSTQGLAYLPKAAQVVNELTGFGLVPVLPLPAAMLLIVVTF